MASHDHLTLRERTLLKIDQAQHQHQGVDFELNEARLAGMFIEDALDAEETINDHGNNKSQTKSQA